MVSKKRSPGEARRAQAVPHGRRVVERRLSIAKEAAGLGVYDYDLASGMVECDERIGELWGIDTRQPVPYALVISVIHDEDRRAVLAAVEKAMDPAGEGSYVAEYRVVNSRDGVERWITATGRAFFEKGRAARLVGAVQDITERKRAAEALADSEARFHRLFDHMAEGFFLAEVICDEANHPIDHRYLEVNPAFERLLGISREAMVGRTVKEVLPDVEPSWIESYGRVALTGNPERFRRFSAAFGRHYDVVAYSPQPGRFACVFTDATDAIQAEEELRASSRRAETDRRRLAAVVEALPVGVAILDTAGGTILANQAFDGIWGEGRPMTRSIHDYARFKAWWADSGRPVEVHEWAAARVIETGEPVVDQLVEIERFDGQHRFVLNSASPVRDADGQLLGGVVAIQDVTALRRAQEALRQADRRKDEFIAVLSHELRNPLAPIRYALPVLAGGCGAEGVDRAVGVIARQVEHMTRLLDDLLDVARVTSDKVELRRDYVTLAAVVKTAVETSAPAVAAGQHLLKVAVPDEPLWLHGDAARLSQVVTNLLDNAAKFTPPHGELELTVTREGAEGVIRVRDNGVGIASDVLETVFDMFYQAQRGDTPHGGLGIGLGLVKKLVEMHGGRVKARSAGIGQGAEFAVWLPLAPEASGVEEQATVSTAGAAPRLKVLIVDDNADLVEMLTLFVESLGHEVQKAFDGPTAVAAALFYRPDVVLLDLGLPGMSGLEVARELRRRPQTQNTYLVAVTGWGQEDDLQKTAAAGFDSHLTKPSAPGLLEELLHKVATVARRC